MRKIRVDVVAALISLGRTGVPDIPDCLADQQTAWYALVRPKEVWLKVAEVLSEDELRHLIHGLVLYSRARGRGVGGSVSPVIALYYDYIARFPGQEPALTAWVVDNRVNDYDPFGSACDEGARTYAEFLERQELRWREHQARLLQRQQDAARLKQMRDAEKATTNLAGAVRRGDLKAVMALLAKGADPSKAVADGGSLVALAEANGRTEVAAYLRSQGMA